MLLCPLCLDRNEEKLPSGLHECMSCGGVFSKRESLDKEHELHSSTEDDNA